MAILRSPALFLLFLLAGPMIMTPFAVADELPFSHHTTDRSALRLPSTSIQNVHQDRSGFLWLATFSTGVARYDGQRLETFGLADGVIDPTVREIVEDASGHLWLGGEAGLMVSREPLGDPTNRPVFITMLGDEELPRTRVRHHWLRADPAGGVWLGTAGDGLLHLDVHEGEVRRRSVLVEPGMDVQPAVSGLIARADGTVWVGLGTASVVTFDAAVPDPEVEALDFDAVPPVPLGAFAERDGTLWAGAFDGTLWRFDEEAHRFVRLPPALGETVKALYVAPDGVLWAGSLGGGLARYDTTSGEVRVVRRAEGLPSETLWDLEVDREGTLWMAHNAGLSRLRADYRAFRQITGRGRTPQLPEPTVFGVLAPGDDGLVWVGTGGGLTALDHDPAANPASDEAGTEVRRAVLGTDDGLSSGSVYAMERDADGRLWLGTAAGLDILSFDAELPASLVPGPVREVEVLGRAGRLGNYGFSTVYAIRQLSLPAGPATCLAGVDGLACLVAGAWKIFGPLSGVPASGATAVAADAAGHLWVGTKEDGALRSTGAVTAEALEEWTGGGPVVTSEIFAPGWNRDLGAASDSVRSLAVTGDAVWVAHAAGLDRLVPDGEAGGPTHAEVEGKVEVEGEGEGEGEGEISHRHHGAAEGLGGDHVVAIEPTPDGRRLWVAAGGGLTELDAEEGTVLRRVTRDQGLLDDEAWVSHSLRVGADGTVYFGTPRGLTVYDPARHEPTEPVATPTMRSVEVQAASDGDNRIRLAWTAATYLDPDAVRFSTRLVGLDDEWSPADTGAEATYTHLPAFFLPKTYTFQVRTSPSPGVWLDDVLEVDVTVPPPWWLSWWALVLWLALLALLLWAARRTRPTGGPG